ncbi:hypothetical protein HK100_012429 [Physocladia obscura]|uniref:Cytidyltransferase-like domain-containing protein n=1 Tax=Physocladia obscura TaxID=109957 RepID=A0AAD5XD80_9FUNG|nr:hypothetical protein HK100_012429 [Physocladia obscura]
MQEHRYQLDSLTVWLTATETAVSEFDQLMSEQERKQKHKHTLTVTVTALTAAYEIASQAAASFDLSPLLKIRVFIEGLSSPPSFSVSNVLVLGFDAAPPRDFTTHKFQQVNLNIAPQTISTQTTRPPPFKCIPLVPNVPQETNSVVLGGTFDHLHSAHLLLLSVAALLAKSSLICGVYDFSQSQHRLLKKSHYEYMQPLSLRITAVNFFLHSFKPSLIYRVEPILDDYGPTRYESDIQAIVCSAETEAGCLAVNQLRQANNLPLLDIYVIGVVKNAAVVGLADGRNFADKISSSYLREYLSQQK